MRSLPNFFRLENTLIFAMLISLGACARLDDNLFNPEKVTAYKLGKYTGVVDFTLDDTYAIEDSLLHIFTLPSQGPGEKSATTIYALYIGDLFRIATDTVILYCHGNRDHMDFYWPRTELLANTGFKNRFGVMTVDYRGYGMSEGSPTENGLYADVNAAILWLKTMGLTNDRLIVYGFSMGSAPATKVTADPSVLTPAKLVLEAPFANAETMVQDATGLALPGIMVTDLKINNAEVIRTVQQPLLWLHGEADTFLNINTQGQVVFDNYHGTYKEGHRIPGAEHGTIEITMGFREYLDVVNNFICRP